MCLLFIVSGFIINSTLHLNFKLSKFNLGLKVMRKIWLPESHFESTGEQVRS